MKRIAATLAVAATLAMFVTPANASSTTGYRARHFYCTHTKMHAWVKVWEYGKSGVMQFELIFKAQEHFSGSWHTIKVTRHSSNVFADTRRDHFYFFSQAFIWSTNRRHRELVKMIWWHRHPNRVVRKKTLVTRSCR